jgi:hypothetical protein
MKSRTVELADDDPKAIAWIRENLEMCAYAHSLSKKLLGRFSAASGVMTAFVPDWVDLPQLQTYNQGSVPPAGGPTYYRVGDSPLDDLALFVREYLRATKEAVAVCENDGDVRKSMSFWTWGPPPRTWLFGANEVYYILESGETDVELIDSAVGDTLGHWGVAVCSSCARIPERDVPDETFLEEIAENTKHILMPAFDNDGYMIWTPGAPVT